MVVDGPPVAAFTWTPQNPTTGQPVTFDATSSQNAVSWVWDDVGPNGTGSWPVGPPGEIMQFTFANVGTKYIRLVVENDLGDTDSIIIPVAVSGGLTPPPTAPSVTGSATADTLTWSWTRPDATDGFEVQINDGSWDDVGDVQTHVIDQLALGQTRTLRVRAYNSAGTGPESQPRTLTTANPPDPGDPTPTVMQSEVTQHGITWTFDQDYPVGQYANGDYFVVGPVTITAILPAPETVPGGWSGGSGGTQDWHRHGAMVNPGPADGGTLGYGTQRANSYSPAKNVALNLPTTFQPNSSIVHTTARTEPYQRPSVETAAVLTVVDVPPPQGSFRPPYSA